jgi:hypothetical protein
MEFKHDRQREELSKS